MDLTKVDCMEFADINDDDAPDYVDAYISYADYAGEDMTESQLAELNENTEFVHEKLIEYLN
jgi:hypothetical protein